MLLNSESLINDQQRFARKAKQETDYSERNDKKRDKKKLPTEEEIESDVYGDENDEASTREKEKPEDKKAPVVKVVMKGGKGIKIKTKSAKRERHSSLEEADDARISEEEIAPTKRVKKCDWLIV